MHFRGRSVCLGLFLVVSLNSYCLGEDVYFKTTPKLEHRTIGLRTFEYEVSYYSPPVAIQFITSRSAANYDTPEAAVTSFYSAILINDVDWWFSSFDQNRQKALFEKKEEYDEIKNKLLKEWSDGYIGKIIKLSAYIRYKEYILIDCVVYNPDGTKVGKTGRELTIVKYENGEWKVTVDKGPAAFFMFKWD